MAFIKYDINQKNKKIIKFRIPESYQIAGHYGNL